MQFCIENERNLRNSALAAEAELETRCAHPLHMGYGSSGSCTLALPSPLMPTEVGRAPLSGGKRGVSVATVCTQSKEPDDLLRIAHKALFEATFGGRFIVF